MPGATEPRPRLVPGGELTSPVLSGTVKFSGITGSTQCLQANPSGVVSGSVGACGGTPAGSTGASQYNRRSAFGGAAVSGLVKGNGTSAPSAATSGTDYAPA